MYSKSGKLLRPMGEVEVKNDGDNMVIRVLGAPYGGPDYLDNRDFDGEWYSKDTYFGDDLGVSVIYATLDHANSKDGSGNLIVSPEKLFMGKSTFLGADEMGRWYAMEVTRGENYKKLISALAAKKMLFGSLQPVQTSVVIEADGHIKSWIPAELALTTHPAHPGAVAEVVKSLKLKSADSKAMLLMLKALEDSADEAVVEDEAPVVDNPEEEVVPEETSDSLVDHINKALGEDEESDTELKSSSLALGGLMTEIGEIKIAMKQLHGYVDVVVSLFGSLEDGETLATKMQELLAMAKSTDAALAKTVSRTTEIELGLRSFSTALGDKLKSMVVNHAKQLSDLSAGEKDSLDIADVEAKSKAPFAPRPAVSSIPLHAPGG